MAWEERQGEATVGTLSWGQAPQPGMGEEKSLERDSSQFSFCLCQCICCVTLGELPTSLASTFFSAESPGEDPWPLTVHVFICRLRIQQECELKGVSRVCGTVGSLPPLGQVPLGLALPISARSAKASRDCCGPQQPESEAQVGPQEGVPDMGVSLIRGRGQTP